MTNEKKFLLFLPSFKDVEGHEISFIEVYQKIAKEIKLDLVLFNSSTNKINFKFKNYKIFPSHNKYSKLLKPFYLITNNLKILIKLFKIKEYQARKEDIILIDSTSLSFLPSIIIYLCLRYQSNKIFYYQRIIENKLLKEKLFLFFLNFIFRDLRILTDSKNILQHLRKNKYNVSLMPVPHIKKNKFKNKNFISPDKINIWFPGKPRQDKGISNLNAFLYSNRNNKNINFFCSKDLKLNFKYKFKNFKLKKLEKKKFENLYKIMHFIILPYSCSTYKFRTSGIFLEATSSSKACIIPNDTWMSELYKSRKLENLIINDWAKLDINNITKIYNKFNLFLEINKIRKDLNKFHNSQNFKKLFIKNISLK